jgi:hypothetical protein
VELIASGAPAATRERVTVAVAVWTWEPASLTATPKEKLPLTVGVPEITPVEGLKVRPMGRDPEEIAQV